ncbi:hypothetical protein C8Q80DRAFT_1105448 [Daedaleopsis nitida]|nr:hypothetical protein C8Q80DRAFT_1105448 [Daedaleopsis nitida]
MQSKKAACIAARQAALQPLAPSTPPSAQQPANSAGSPLPEPNIDFEAEPLAFGGDFFGDYDPAFFDDLGDEHHPPNLSTDDDDDDDSPEPENHWEPEIVPPLPHPRAATPASLPADPSPVFGPPLPLPAERAAAERGARRKTHIVSFPGASAGSPLPDATASETTNEQYASHLNHPTRESNMYAPFRSRVDWEVAKWAKLRGAGSTAFSDLLAIEGIAQQLSLSYKNSRELNAIIDNKLPSPRPRFQRHEIVIAGEAFETYFRNILECVEALFGDPDFAPMLLLVPERHYTDADMTERVYFDMNTGKWWWTTQIQLEKERPGATVIPIIISSDKTQLTLIGNKTAYPVYMTLGNLPKDIRCKPSRCGQILLAYLPTSRLLHISSKAARRRTLANLFHACMSRIFEPLASVGMTGMALASGDGVVRRGHPILAIYVGDYPEQLLVTGSKNGECPKCPIPRNEVGESLDMSREFRNLGDVLDALDAIDRGPRAFAQACRAAGIKPLYHPFWEDLPYTDIFLAITPDILHQLYQGVIKHLVAWLQDAYGADEIDARCRRLPPNHSLRHFAKGISNMSRVTGKEHQDISRILLGLIIILPLPDGLAPARLVRATRAILDVLYLAQYPTHTTTTLQLLTDALQSFHDNKSIFVDLGIRPHFRLPKLHSLDHYPRSIELFGTTDNYDTQFSERLHIDFTKDAYRATNHKDELSQMTLWLERKEKIERHDAFVRWRLEEATRMPIASDAASSTLQMTRHPSLHAVKLADVVTNYSAPFFRDALSRFIVQHNHPEITLAAELERRSASVYLPFSKIPVYHRVKVCIEDVQGLGTTVALSRDTIHVQPARKDKYGGPIPARFDTALIRRPNPGDAVGVHRFQVAQIHCVFRIPAKALPMLFPNHGHPVSYPQHLAYVEWFTPFTDTAHRDHGLYKVARSLRGGHRLASVIPVESIERSCHLIPDFGPVAPRDWTSSTVLNLCPTFYVNSFADRNTYMLLY